MRISISHWGEIELGPIEVNPYITHQGPNYIAILTEAIQEEVAQHPFMVPCFAVENSGWSLGPNGNTIKH